MSLLSREIQEHYLKSQESQRLSSGQGELERLRTQAIFTRELPSPPAVVFDTRGRSRYSRVLARTTGIPSTLDRSR